MSAQVALMLDAMKGGPPRSYRLVDKGGLEHYSTVAEGETLLKTAVGDLTTVSFRSRRDGASIPANLAGSLVGLRSGSGRSSFAKKSGSGS